MADDKHPAEPVTEGVVLKRRLGFISGVALIVGNIVGSGIFVSPKGVLQNTGSVGMCLVTWCFCGVLSMCAALVYAELGLLIPKSGSDFAYLLAAFGRFPAFTYTWTRLLLYPLGQIVLALTVAEYISKAISSDCELDMAVQKMLAILVLLLAGILNCISVRLVARIQIVVTFLKLAGLVTIIIGGMIMIAKGSQGSLGTGFEGTTKNPTNFATAVYSGMWAFDGWSQLNNVVEEVKRPKRNLPLCIATSLLLVLVVYILVNVSYFAVLTKEEYLSSWAVAANWAEYALTGAVVVIPITVACSVFGTMTGAGFAFGRIVFAAGREGLFPEILCYLNVKTNIPLPPILLMILCSIIMVFQSSIAMLLNIFGFITWFFYGLGMIAHLVLRSRMKKVERPLQVPIFIPVIVLLFCIYLVIAPFMEPVKAEFWYAVAYLAIGTLLYTTFVVFRLDIPGMKRTTQFLQLLMYVAPPEKFQNHED